MRWRLILEELGPELKYIKGENNVVADTLYCLEKSPNQEIFNISEIYGYDVADLPDIAYPISYQDIAKAHKTTVYTDHNNLTYTFLNIEHVMCWRLRLEEIGP